MNPLFRPEHSVKEPSLFQTDKAVIPYDNMIQKFDPDQSSCFVNTSGYADILLAWLGIPARMIVQQDDRNSISSQRFK